METLCFFPSLLLRTPLFSFQKQSPETLPAVLHSTVFKNALFLASSSFYQELEKTGFDYSKCTAKQRASLQKYFNRARYRSTPFGLFSSSALISWKKGASNVTVSSPSLSLKPDFGLEFKSWERSIRNGTFGERTCLRINPTLYSSGIDFRYVQRTLGPEGQFLYQMVSVVKSNLLKMLARYCKQSRRYSEVVEYLVKTGGAEKADAEHFLCDLVSRQILVPDNEPALTRNSCPKQGLDYLLHAAPEVEQFADIAALFRQHIAPVVPLAGCVRPLLSLFNDTDNGSLFYARSERAALMGGISEELQAELLDGIQCLGRMGEQRRPADLERFRERFVHRFESQEVPLLEALDPQFGIGYGSFGHIGCEYGLLGENTGGLNHEKTSSGAGAALPALLIRELQLMQGKAGSEIEIKDEHLRAYEPDASVAMTPPSLAVLFRTTGENVVIEAVSGPSALGLLGRFSFGEENLAFAREIAEKEQAANPEVVFAELLHLNDLHTANINRRPHLRHFEIPVLCSSTLTEDRQISLDDLVVSVKNDQVVLRSKRLQKVVVPRLSSAFNYQKSTFPAFRFLCDLQHQGLRSFAFSLAASIPGLRYYPRVRYRRTILQLAEWHLQGTELKALTNLDEGMLVAQFRNFAEPLGLPRFFAFCIHDNFLLIDSENGEDLALFVKEAAKLDAVMLREFPYLNGTQVVDETGNPLIGQYVAALYNKERVYGGKVGASSTNAYSNCGKATRDWIYFKIYCHPLSSGVVLANHLFPLVKKLEKSLGIPCWFWIRYQDPEYHIRLRIKTSSSVFMPALFSLTSCLNKLYETKLVSSYQSGVYSRELERYSPELIEPVEHVFMCSSRVVFELVKKAGLPEERFCTLTEATNSVLYFLKAFQFSAPQSATLCKLQFEQFAKEFEIGKEVKQRLDRLYKELLRPGTVTAGCAGKAASYKPLYHAVACLAQRFASQQPEGLQKEQLACDLIHMHLNRLFSHDQRYYEMVSYYLAYRVLGCKLHQVT